MSGKPWPSDALMIVCETPAGANRENMQSVNPVNCRDCLRDLVVDGASLKMADANPLRHGRPVMFFCIPCAVKYDFVSIDSMTDNRGGKLTKKQ